jgi:hypothetical protein
MRKLYVLAVILLAVALSGIQPQSASGGVCPPSHLTCVEVDSYVETCYGGARICTVYQCSGGASYTCCTICEGPF